MHRVPQALRFALALAVLLGFGWWSYSAVDAAQTARNERSEVLGRITELQSAQLVLMTTDPFAPEVDRVLSRMEAVALPMRAEDASKSSAGALLARRVAELRLASPGDDAEARTVARTELIIATDRAVASLWDREQKWELELEFAWLRIEALAWCGVALGLIAVLLWGLALRRGARSEELAGELAKALEGAQAGSAAKSDFIAVVSHEIRTPLTAMLGSAELLEHTDLNDRQLDHVRVIRSGGDSLLHIVSDVLDLSRLDVGRLEFASEPFEVEPLLDGVALLFWERANEQGLQLSVCASPRVPTAVMGDGSRLRQVLVNLVSNAVKFTREGFVRVDADYRGGELVLTVTDTGPGVPLGARTKIFEAFTQAEMDSRRQHGGTGLGLAISTRLVGGMRGRLELAVPEVGSRFTVHVPAEVVVAATPLPPDAVRLGATAPPELRAQLEVWRVPIEDGADLLLDADSVHGPVRPGAVRRRLERRERTGVHRVPQIPGRLHALVVDDNAASRAVVAEMLGALGCRVDQAAGGREAIGLAGDTGYSLIFMDCDMPDVDGLEATRSILEARPLPVVGLSGHATAEFRERALSAGMTAYLTKPVRLADLRRALETWAAV
ncbi:MAG: response regulator [Proteobacteria bacterium]|nr:response regulator [Pseudomonadota bacterium]